MTKVFVIGFHKTGTTSLSHALTLLGYSVTGPNGVRDPNIAKNVERMALALVDQHDAFQDNPWPILFEKLDRWCPNSKFILTMRDTEKWIRSQVRHFGKEISPMREWIYGKGCPEGNEDVYIERYERHNRDVMEYFKDRSEDLLVMSLERGDGWEELCPFLGKAMPDVSFPKKNTYEERAGKMPR